MVAAARWNDRLPRWTEVPEGLKLAGNYSLAEGQELVEDLF
jgi:hypothetical protein